MANIVLTGFMCTGKTQVGRHLASALGMRFVDLDAFVEERAGKKIARIFAEDGEAKFRALERKAVAHLAKKNGLVLATGTGTLADRRNLSDLRRSGILIGLAATPEKILERAKRGGWRATIKTKNPRAHIARRMAERAPQYAKADYQVDTTDSSLARVAAKIARLLGVVEVALGERSYEIVIGRGILSQASEYIARLDGHGEVVVISEENVWGLHGEALSEGLGRHKRILLPSLEHPERLKSLRQAEGLYDQLLDLGVRRDALLVAFGGGTVGDLAGFVAATYMRGVDFVQVPTTLLAQADSSVGGKVAVNHAKGKNLIGAFWQPRLVLADLHCLDTLPRQELRNGLAEIVKHALIADARLFRYLEDNAEDVMRLHPPSMRHLLWRNCQIKAGIVSKDEREGGVRALLNLGHTFGHALESCVNYHGISHGEAVSIGMVAAARLACEKGLFSENALSRLLDLLHDYHLPTVAPKIAFAQIREAMKLDKKARQGGLRFVIPERIGKARQTSGVQAAEIRRALGSARGGPAKRSKKSEVK